MDTSTSQKLLTILAKKKWKSQAEFSTDNEYFQQGNRQLSFYVLYEKLNATFLWAVRVLVYNWVTVKLSSV